VIALRLGRIDQLLARRVRPVEWNKIWCHFLARRLVKGADPPGPIISKLAAFATLING